MQTATPRTPKPPYSPACEVRGCIDLNKKLTDAIRERGQQHPEGVWVSAWVWLEADNV